MSPLPNTGPWGAGVRARSRAPVNMGICPPGGPVRSSGCLSPCPVCRKLWTKQALGDGDSPPFPALVIHQLPSSPPPNSGLGITGLAGSGEVAPVSQQQVSPGRGGARSQGDRAAHKLRQRESLQPLKSSFQDRGRQTSPAAHYKVRTRHREVDRT